MCGEVELLYGFILSQQSFPSLVSWVSLVCAGQSLLEAPWLCISAGMELL